MKKTKLPSIDKFFEEVQEVADAICDIKDPIDDKKDALLHYTGFDKTKCATSHHAIVGLVFSMASKVTVDELVDLIKISTDEPFIEINKKAGILEDAQAVDQLMEYIKTLIATKDKIEPLVEKVQSLAKTVVDMPSKAKAELGKANDLKTMDKLRAVRNTAYNVSQTAELPGIVKELQETITDSLMEIQEAAKELGDKIPKLAEIRQKCIDAKCKNAKD